MNHGDTERTEKDGHEIVSTLSRPFAEGMKVSRKGAEAQRMEELAEDLGLRIAQTLSALLSGLSRRCRDNWIVSARRHN